MSESQAFHQAEMQPSGSDALFGEEYYRTGFGPTPYERNSHWLNFFSGIASEIIRSLRPRRVFDAGCGWAFLVEALYDRGTEAWGRDISAFAIGKVRPDIRARCSVGSLAEPIPGGPYDLVTCIEVLEHMTEEDAREAIRQMTQVTEAILFSSTPNDFDEPTHVNVHPIIYWLRIWSECNFYPELSFDASFIAPHAFLVRRREPVPDDALLIFNETLRLRGSQAAFLTRHGRIEELEREIHALRREVNEVSREQVDNLLARIATGEREVLSVQEANEAARKQFMQDTAELQYRLENSKVQTTRAEGTLAEWMVQHEELSRKLELVSSQYDSLLSDVQSLMNSPGWHFIVRYRDWLRSNRLRHSWVRRLWEPSMVWALRGMKLVGQLSHPMPSSNLLGATKNGQDHQSVRRPAIRNALSDSPLESVPDTYQTWIVQNEPDGVHLEIQRRMSGCFSYRPKISVLVPVYKVPVPILRDAVNSVLAQTYDNWELCISLPVKDNPEARIYLEEAASHNERIKLIQLPSNEGISGNSNQALTLVTGEYLALLDHDDLLAPFALFEIVQLLNQDKTVNFIYSDKDQITEDGARRMRPLFKPKWSPEIMLNANYLTHLSVMRTDHVRSVGGWRKETDGAQDWDLFLRLADRFGNIQHLAKVLYHWRQVSTSVSVGGLQAKPYAAQAQVRCVQDHCESIGLQNVSVNQGLEGLRLLWPKPEARVSVVYIALSPDSETPSRAAKLAEQTSHPNFEILVPTFLEVARSTTVQCITVSPSASLAERIERAVQSASGQILVFFDEHVTPTDPGWLAEMAGSLLLPSVGIVGAKLLDPHTRNLRHCGIVFTLDGRLEYIYAGQPEHVNEPAGAANWYRNWTAVSGACFAIRRQVWDAVGGLAGDTLYPRLDINLNLKMQLRTDWRILYNPFARFLQHHESALEASLASDRPRAMASIRAYYPAGDPHFNANLDCRDGNTLYRTTQRSAGGSNPKDYSMESQALVEIYDYNSQQLDRSNRAKAKPNTGRLETVTWVLPDFANAFYGGVHTILRFADVFQRTHNVRSQFCILGHGSASRVQNQVAAAFPQVSAASKFFVVDSSARVNELPMSDATVCSLWTTAYAALECNNTRKKFYFIQDDEVLFYPAGSTSALVEATYNFGFYGICNTVALRDRYIGRGGQGEYFSPCIDTSVFHSRNRKTATGALPYTLFFYGRPGHPRNCFEFISAALHILRKRMGEELLVVSAGADWDPREYGLEGIVENLGVLNYQSTGALYRMCDAGLVMMMTRHPSYLPLELMGCGTLVITNRNPDSGWLLKDGENCLLADLSPSCLADCIEEGLKNTSLRRKVTANAVDLVAANYSNWEVQIEKIYSYMRDLC